jgi:protein arginine kinase
MISPKEAVAAMNNSFWYNCSAPNNDVVVSSRIRLARNLKDVPFPAKLKNQSEANTVLNAVSNAVRSAKELEKFKLKFLDLSKINKTDKLCLLERHLVSPDLVAKSFGTALFFSEDESLSMMLNEEDHLRIQVLSGGLNLEEAYKIADNVDSVLDSKLKFAFNESFGYLTQCPTNLGTGLRASLMLHLPALKRNGIINRITKNILKLGLTIRGMYGEGSEPIGAMYQLSNQVTLGISEKAAIKNLTDISLQLISQEKSSREELKSSVSIQDEIHRSFGILKNCRLLDISEFMNLFSNLRLGVAIGEIQGPTFEEQNELMFCVQRASVCKRSGKESLPIAEQNKLRASMVREALARF